MEHQTDFVLNILSGLKLFEKLDDHDARELSKCFQERVFDQGEIIFKEESIGNSMMIITSGEVRVSQTPAPDQEEALIILKEGDVFGEMALIDDQPRSATTIANTDVIIFEISRPHFLHWIKDHCQSGVMVLMRLARILSARLRETDNKLKAFVNLSQWI